MLFSQYIYTSWNNGSSPDKGFMVYGKSRDVTEDEDKEILATMRYKPFKSLPYAPTQLQIDKEFPKNYAVFKLRSGRTCIALASYIGLDYVKDDNPRWGNYLIHALIADVEDTRVPHLLNSGLFKTFLSKEEQDAPAGPHILDPIDISTDYLSYESSSFELDEEFWNVAQATINAKLARTNVFINIEQSLINDWVDRLVQILPSAVSRDLTYSTYMLNKNPSITLNFIHKESPTFRPEEEILNTDNYVFYTSNSSLQSPVTLENYIFHMKNIYYNNGSMISYRQSIDEICCKYNIEDVNVACDILDFLNGDASFCSDTKNMQKIIALFDNNGERCLSQIIDEIVSVLEQFGDQYHEDKYSIMNTIYGYVDTLLQSKFKAEIWEYIYQVSNDVVSITCELKKYNNVYNQDTDSILEDYLLQTISMSKSEKLAKEYCSAKQKTIKNLNLLEWYKQSIRADIISHISSKNYDSAKSAIETRLKKCDDYDELIGDVFGEAITLGFGVDITFDFYMLELVSDDFNLFLQGLHKVLSCYSLSSMFIDKMEQCVKKAKCMSDKKLEDYLNAQFPDYFVERDKWIFFNSNNCSRNELCDFYKKHVVGMLEVNSNNIVDQFCKKLNGYLAVLSNENKLKESCTIFNFIMGLDTSKKINKTIFEILYKTAFSNMTFEKIVMCNVKEDDVIEMNYYATVFDVSLLSVTLLLKDYLWFKKYSEQNVVAGFDIQQSTEDLDFYYLNAYCSCDDRHNFMIATFDFIIKFLVKYFDVTNCELFFERLTSVFVYDKEYKKIFVKYLLSKNYFDQEHLMVFSYCIHTKSDYSTYLMDDVWRIYLKKIGKQDREALFKFLLDKSNNREVVAEYIKQYKSDNKSFFERIFSRPPKEQVDNTNPKNASEDRKEKNRKE